jgi:hypothetical protein
MQRPLLLLAVSAFLVACETTNNSSANADAGPRFSWQKDVPAAPVAVDNTRTSIVAVNKEFSLLELSRAEKAEPKSRLQLSKAGKQVIVEVIKADEKTTIVGIVAGQSGVPEFKVGDNVPVAVVAAPAQ